MSIESVLIASVMAVLLVGLYTSGKEAIDNVSDCMREMRQLKKLRKQLQSRGDESFRIWQFNDRQKQNPTC